jgi:sec-independent protein translocase protein TatA
MGLRSEENLCEGHMFGLGFQELLVVLLIALLFFGGKKLPEIGSALGQAIREFKRGTTEPSALDRPASTTPESQAKKELPAEDRDRV